MNANPNQRLTAIELYEIFDFWDQKYKLSRKRKFGYKGKEIKFVFKEADKEIQNISTSYEINPDAIYTTSRVFTFRNLSEPINSPIIASLYLHDEENNKDILFKGFYHRIINPIITNFVTFLIDCDENDD
ncbi:hypothetical protein C1646_763864 [Rhizophagus diaphanus]|nr:hypothetical protein C1646_763864 [Rhizophagus diaphanus] [Rhizophagus sp. MUCL 43196]